jgi:DNA (cytosine-5)-methyltransferase 1
MAAYYNEIDKFAAAWLRELIKEGLIADGEVDERDIRDVQAGDLRGFTQCHFFAGIGGWSYALRLAGWTDNRPVWTGSCPCQPFSSAGKGEGGADDRHLWPHWARLIRECQPVTIFGEQVESAIAHGWIDDVFDDLEREGYACGAACLPAASVGAFHRRQRVWFVADATDGARLWAERCGDERVDAGRSSKAGELADNDSSRRGAWRTGEASGRRDEARIESSGLRYVDDLGLSSSVRLPQRECNGSVQREAMGSQERQTVKRGGDSFWSHAEWIYCRDGKYRPVEPGTFPLAHGAPARVGRLRGYGNAIVPACAAAFIEAYCDISEDRD